MRSPRRRRPVGRSDGRSRPRVGAGGRRSDDTPNARSPSPSAPASSDRRRVTGRAGRRRAPTRRSASTTELDPVVAARPAPVREGLRESSRAASACGARPQGRAPDPRPCAWSARVSRLRRAKPTLAPSRRSRPLRDGSQSPRVAGPSTSAAEQLAESGDVVSRRSAVRRRPGCPHGPAAEPAQHRTTRPVQHRRGRRRSDRGRSRGRGGRRPSRRAAATSPACPADRGGASASVRRAGDAPGELVAAVRRRLGRRTSTTPGMRRPRAASPPRDGQAIGVGSRRRAPTSRRPARPPSWSMRWSSRHRTLRAHTERS